MEQKCQRTLRGLSLYLRPSDLQEVERETMQSSESEWRMMEISKQRNGIDRLYRKTTNICQDCILYAASANPHCIGLRTGNWFKLRSKLSILKELQASKLTSFPINAGILAPLFTLLLCTLTEVNEGQ